MAGEGGVREFRNDDDSYLSWLDTHPDGYVTNILGSYSLSAARTHRVVCHTIQGRPPRGRMWTGPKYVKWCAEHLVELDQRAVTLAGDSAARCGICLPTGGETASAARPRTEKPSGPSPSVGRFAVDGPTPRSRVVQAWADDYIRFERRPAWHEHLREEIRRRCRELGPAAGQVLHAEFFGEKLPNADVENLALYNIDTFRNAGRYGLRFEYGAAVPPAPDAADYRFGYRYGLALRSGSFDHWRQGRELASFGWTNLGAFAGEKKLAQVWRAIARGDNKVGDPISPGSPFLVSVEVRPPYRHGREPVWGGLVKGIFDGVICALQGHTGPLPPRDVLERLAEQLGAPVEDLEELLNDPPWTVLGEVPGLVSAYRGGVKWAPSDHLCVAGELLAAESAQGEDNWAIQGRIVAVSRQQETSDPICATK